MTKLRAILVATDLSENAAKAERRAVFVRRNCADSHCELLHVLEPEGPDILAMIWKTTPENARASITQKAMQTLRPRAAALENAFNVRFNCAVAFGQPANEIVTHSEKTDADLIIAGAHGSNFIEHLFLGGTVDKLARLSTRPVLVVKNEPVSEYRHVLVPVDFSEDSKQAARVASTIAPNALITLLHAYDLWFAGKIYYAQVDQDAVDYYRSKAHADASAAMHEFLAALGMPDRTFTQQLVFDRPSFAIERHAEKAKPDLIVMGKHGKSRMEELLIGSVTRHVLEQCQCDVLAVPPLAQAIKK